MEGEPGTWDEILPAKETSYQADREGAIGDKNRTFVKRLVDARSRVLIW
jgi:hypothetical protein